MKPRLAKLLNRGLLPAAAVAATLALGAVYWHSLTVPPTAPPRAAQPSHYIIFFATCGVLDGVLVTSGPGFPVWVSHDHPANSAMLRRMAKAAAANRVMGVDRRPDGCPPPVTS